MASYLELTKPRITWLILVCTGIGFWFGSAEPGMTWALWHTLLGTALLASGTAALNQWWEREADARMRRTARRPIPSGKISPRRALLFGVLLSLAGFLELWRGVNLFSALLGLFTLLSYLFLYTPLKQVSPLSTAVGAVPGAMPPVIGYAAAGGRLDWEGLALFAILFLWQFPHFDAIAWMYREDYARAGIRMLPVVQPDGEATARRMVACSLLLIPTSLVPGLLGMAGAWYVGGAVLLGAVFARAAWRVARERSTVRARQVLLTSVFYLPALFALMLADRGAAWL